MINSKMVVEKKRSAPRLEGKRKKEDAILLTAKVAR
jgi:hypothetical protein